MKNEKFDIISETSDHCLKRVEKKIEWIEKRMDTFEGRLIIVEDRLNRIEQPKYPMPNYPCPSPYPPFPENTRSFVDDEIPRLKFPIISNSFENT